MSNYDLKLSTTQPNHVEFMEFRQDDILSRTLNVAITSHDLPRDLTGYDVFLNSTLPSRNIARDKVTNFIDKVNGKFSYTLIDSFVQDTGRVATWFSIEKGGSTTQVGEVIDSTTNFSFSVVPGYRDCVKQGNYIWEFEELLRYVTGLANQSQVQLDKLINDVEGIQQQIDDMFALIASQGVLSADEVRQLLIKFMSGEDIEVTIKSDFNTPPKVAGSIVENGNIFKRNSSIGLQLPSHNTWGENSQAHYDAIKKLDDTVATFSYSSEGAVAAGGTPWNILWALEQNFPSIFKNTTTIAEKVAIAKNKITYLNLNAYGKGSGPNGNKFYLNAFNVASGAWATPVSHVLSTIGKLTYSYHRPDILLSSEGLINVAMYTDSSNGTIASSVSIDYPNVELRVKFNIKDFVPTRQEFDTHVADAVKHITVAERATWNGKQNKLYESGLRYPTMGGGASSNPSFRVNYEKVGRLVSFGGRAFLPSVTATQIQIASVPLEFAPQQQKFFEVTVAGRQTDLFAKIVIDVDGIIYCYFCNSTSQYFVLDGINYLTKD